MPIALNESYFTELLRAIRDKLAEEIRIGDIGGGIQEAISTHVTFRVNLFGVSLPFTDAVVSTWIAMAIIAVLAVWLGRGFREVPKGKQVLSEGFVGLLMNLCKGQHMTEEQAEKVAPFIGTLGTLICLSNCFSVFKLAPPSKDFIFPVTLAVFTICYVIFTGIRLVGLKGFWKSLTYPKAALVPFKILDYLIKPISLSLRLFGNIFGAFILMEFISIVLPVILPGILGIWFDLADGILQGGVFAYLSTVYIGEIVEGAHQEPEDSEKPKRQRPKADAKQATDSVTPAEAHS